MLYQFHEWQRLWMAPWRSFAEATKTLVDNPYNPWAQTPLGKVMASTAGMFGFSNAERPHSALGGRAACGYDGQGSRLADIPTGSTTAGRHDKQDSGSVISERNTP